MPAEAAAKLSTVARRGRKPGEQTIVRTKLAAWRVRRGLTQEELAKLAGISRSKLIRLERSFARTDMRVEDLAQLALALGCEPADLLEDAWMRWRNTTVDLDDVPNQWRDEVGTSSRPPTQAQAERELRSLLKQLPETIQRRGARPLVLATAGAPQLAGAARAEDIAAILERDAKASEEHRRRALALRRVAALRQIV